MLSLLVTWLLSALSVMIMAFLMPGIHVSGFSGALIAAVAIGVVNALIKPLLQLITLPITFLTLGFFLLIVNAICLEIADWLAGTALEIDSFGWAFLGAILLAIVSSVVNHLFTRQVASSDPG